ncbi:hypothetical protein SEA_TAPIOCA_46 [Mycobacterium phage Tapioca]|uniref:Uncharacterized protein n=10 Tax=Charlievirus TaxID=1623280 RepID=A0A142K7W4_9CAUD|nr:hypothetical protein AVV74_gp44 [Mycobacterium phage Carcharodon]YP_009616897.1 hypothetical protein FDI84_gp44 [Mycobacterium phage Pipsqueaks]YP_010052180.1 hypothetical protein KD932_gp43 [Mycobacterium phage Fulbright]YP_010052319.1 hypothetical protein KD934_gp46 [Mycobacterium phage Tapioca]AMS01990.1 hypothetical protein SEA_XERXES_44 [Mycobacterium phage Xerxes]AWY04126.1 hypothetical protein SILVAFIGHTER_45 [Mycobacterium phage Silvafighter]AXQ52614.1 hypothetical protein SEA_GEX_
MSTRQIDMTPESSLERVANIAIDVAEKIREDDPRRLYAELVNLAQWHPAKAAQVTMALAAFFNPDEGTATLRRRVEAITAHRCRVIGVAS